VDATESAYIGGPLIKDKLFFFAAVEGRSSRATASAARDLVLQHELRVSQSEVVFENRLEHQRQQYPRADRRVDRRIRIKGNEYDYDYATGKTGAFNSYGHIDKNNARSTSPSSPATSPTI
jgi:hypothetical protein